MVPTGFYHFQIGACSDLTLAAALAIPVIEIDEDIDEELPPLILDSHG